MADGTYGTVAGVRARVPYRTITTNSAPTTAQVEQWIAEAEAHLEATLSAIEVSVPVTNARGVSQLKSWTEDYAEGHLRMAYAASGGDGNNDDGRDILTRFYDRINDMIDKPTIYGAMMSGGNAPDSARRVRAYVLDNDDSKTISGDDFTPTFTRDEVF